MNYKWLYLLLATQLLFSCGVAKRNSATGYKIVSIEGTIIEMNKDHGSNKEMQDLVDKYKVSLDKEMSQVLGRSEEFMQYKRPESLLTNFTSDAMREYGKTYFKDGADISFMNVNGHRANLPAGDITMGNMYETYSFDNAIVFLELKGEDLIKIFEAYARLGGAGISSNVRLKIKDKKIVSATLDGEPVDKKRIYKVVTIDYLADGNDSMVALKNAINLVETGKTLRDVMIDYVKQQTAEGKLLSSQLDGRIIIE